MLRIIEKDQLSKDKQSRKDKQLSSADLVHRCSTLHKKRSAPSPPTEMGVKRAKRQRH